MLLVEGVVPLARGVLDAQGVEVDVARPQKPAKNKTKDFRTQLFVFVVPKERAFPGNLT